MNLKNKHISFNFKFYSPAFTLVELIVVIVILSILATISFLSFNSYSSNSRDSVRLGDLNNIKKGLELYQVKTATYPIPEGTIYTGTVNGVDVVYKGIIGDNISNIINVSKTPKDPIDTTKNYIYGITYDKTKYQIAITLENASSTTIKNGKYKIENELVENTIIENNGVNNLIDTSITLRGIYTRLSGIQYDDDSNSVISSLSKNPFLSLLGDSTNRNNEQTLLNNTRKIPGTSPRMTISGLNENELSLLQLDNALALSNNSNINNNSRQARVSGMYNGYIKFNSGTNIYLANIPSLIYNSTGSINLLSTGVYYVVNKNSNLPYTISNTDIYNNKSGDIIIQEYTNKTGATLTGVDITSIVNSTDSTTRTNLINSTFSGTILDSFGGNINTINSLVNGGVSSSSNNNKIEAAGGIISFSGGYKIHTFLTSGSFNVSNVPAGAKIDYLIVAGGGGGGRNQSTHGGAGGGGAGGFLTGTGFSIITKSYTVTIGNGGNGSTTDNTQGGDGSNSVFDNLIAIGGGGGGGQYATAGRPGGSGGGTAQAGAAALRGLGTVGQGNDGGHSNGGNYNSGPGGGGAGGAGLTVSVGNVGSAGGPGLASSISGFLTYYAGGGGGGGRAGGGGNAPGPGGIGGGGIGGSANPSNGGNGSANSGGGGGAGTYGGSGGNGGSGIVIIRYLY